MDSLYQDRLLALAKELTIQSGQNQNIDQPTHVAEVNNPLCGDNVTAHIRLENQIICQSSIQVKGCVLCQAGARLWLDNTIGKQLHDMQIFHHKLEGWLLGEHDDPIAEDINAFTPIRSIKNRHKCVLLPFDTATKFTAIS